MTIIIGKKCKLRLRHLPRRTPYRTEERDKTLLKLGFASYRDYLHSKLWKLIRAGKLEETPKCELCGCAARHVHHMDYTQDTLQGRKPWKLVCLCAGCHKSVEFREDGSKKNHEAVYKQLKRRLKERGAWERHIDPEYLAKRARRKS